MNSYISLTHGDLLLASIFLAMNAVFSILLSLRLERQLIVSALRMVTQLFLVGLVLKTVFTLTSPWLTLLTAAAQASYGPGRSHPGEGRASTSGAAGFSAVRSGSLAVRSET